MGKLIRATHDLNDVKTLEISGWPGIHRVEFHSAAGVEIETPERAQGEFWTFSKQAGNTLRCFTSLKGSPGLITKNNPATGQPWPPMIIRIPEKRKNELVIKCA